MWYGSAFAVFFARTNFNKCLRNRYSHIVHNTRTFSTRKTGSFPNISTIFQFLGVSFAAMNATKYLFCCVRFSIRADMVKMCSYSVDSAFPRFFALSSPSGVPGCFWIHRGRGISRARVSRELAPQPPKTEKRPPSPLKKSRKNKKGNFQFYKSSLRSLHKYIFNSLLTYRYVYGIFKAHRRCYQCKSIKQLGK